jgi:hypothetical protein
MKTGVEPNSLRTVVITDCGSTTTKALLFQKTDEGWRCTGRGEAPTTVEDPVADVTVGVQNAFIEIQETTGRRVINESLDGESERPFLVTESDQGIGIDAPSQLNVLHWVQGQLCWMLFLLMMGVRITNGLSVFVTLNLI